MDYKEIQQMLLKIPPTVRFWRRII